MRRWAGVRAIRVLGVVLGVVLGGCEDPRTHLEGIYRVQGTQRVQLDGNVRPARVKDLVRLDAMVREHDRVALDVASLECRLMMRLDTVRHGALTLSDTAMCPPFETTLTTGCVVTLTFTEGAAYRSPNEGAPLELSLAGPMQTVCSDGRASKGRFILDVTGQAWNRHAEQPAGVGPFDSDALPPVPGARRLEELEWQLERALSELPTHP